MRILIAHSFYRVAGGEDSYVERQVELLRPYHEVRLLQRSNQAVTRGLRAGLLMTWSPTLTRDVVACIDDCQPGVVHLHNAYPSLGPAVHLAAGRRGVALVMTVHNSRLRCPNGLMFTEGSMCHRCEGGVYAHAVLHGCFPSWSQGAAYAMGLWLHRFSMGLERRVAVYIAPSAFMARQLARWGIPTERVEIVRNFAPIRSDASAEPGSYGLFVGRLASEKGLDVLLQALAEAGDPPFRIVGAGPLEEPLRALAGRLRLRNTEFTGRLDRVELDEVVRKARFVALPSVTTENAPLTALEAMAQGRPLLVSAIGGLPELVDSGAGVSCRASEVRGLARNIAELMRDDARCRDAGSRGLEYASANLSPDGHRRRLEAVYEKAASAMRLGSST